MNIGYYGILYTQSIGKNRCGSEGVSAAQALSGGCSWLVGQILFKAPPPQAHSCTGCRISVEPIAQFELSYRPHPPLHAHFGEEGQGLSSDGIKNESMKSEPGGACVRGGLRNPNRPRERCAQILQFFPKCTRRRLPGSCFLVGVL